MEPRSIMDLRIQNILVLTDFSACSQNALLYALNIARRHQSKLTVLHVLPPRPWFVPEHAYRNEVLRAAWRQMKQLQADFLSKDVVCDMQCRLLVRRGRNWKVISRIVKRQNTDLIVLGTRGRTGLKKLMLGSFAESVFRQAPCPVLTIGPGIPDQALTHLPRRLLFPTDNSYVSKAAEPYAFQAARDSDAQLTLLGLVHAGLLPSGKSDIDHQLKRVKERLRTTGLYAAWREGGATPNVVAETGPKVKTVLRVAATTDAELIVLGLSPDTHCSQTFGWDDAYEIVSSSSCPVLTVRHTLADPYFKRLLQMAPVCVGGRTANATS